MKKAWLVFGILIILTLLGLCIPYWVTQNPSKYNFGVSGANEIGDAIGGILSPYFSFIGSVLLAYTIYLQIKTREEDKRNELEKAIFEESLNSLKKAENKFYEWSLVVEENRFLISTNIGKFFRNEELDKTREIGLLLNSINEAISTFNENKIRSEAYQKLFLTKIDSILRLTQFTLIGIWLDEAKRKKGHFSAYFFNYPYLEKYNQVKDFFYNILTFKEYYSLKFEKIDFQPNEIAQLVDTCSWLDSIEADFLAYYDLIFGKKAMAEPSPEEEEKANKIRAKYNLPAKTFD